ncbi:helix-turn-helix transcriptional regulator [Herbiconiux ginsengi]|uniref:Helix-turn-helix domain-containing protein n=1 Tax=Herbiconiux ginsengi TaxID=381665 RepID=A0A1H3TF67_9MICO|nr:helix-turn-helix domain-containing protein [Herbiconiux ginsengi]SDZ48305.1 Helix-turn-helix domain-containing protein [Herbiconiux ginsengi]
MSVTIVPLLLTPAQTAAILGTTTATLRRWRAKGTGPPFHTLGPRSVRYNKATIRAFITTNR